jgi:DMSO/TMAO reductase YedYZ molybdopterin-dependent catalytic subunit
MNSSGWNPEPEASRPRTRRELLKMAPLAGAAFMLSPYVRERTIQEGLALADRASAAAFSPTRLAPTYRDADVTPLDRFPLNSYLVHDPEVDLGAWRLEVSGLVRTPGALTLDAIARLPKVTQNTKHVCIEGWDVIGNFGGARVADVLAMAGADPGARYLEISCADDYYETIDLESARHPQSLFCYEMYGRPLTREHGAPLRLVMPTKLGYKQAKYIVGVRVTNVLTARRGYWEDQGYGWYGGL